MKYNLYDAFSEYENDMPSLTENSENSELERLVMSRLHKKKSHLKMSIKFIFLVSAAVAASITGITVAASEFGLFSSILSKSKIDGSGNLPMLSENILSEDAVQPFVSNLNILFDGDKSMDVKAVGMYSDSLSVMLTLELDTHGKTLPDDACVIPYFSKINGTEEIKLHKSGCGGIESLVKGDLDGQYFLTYYLIDSDLCGNILKITIEDVFDRQIVLDSHDHIIDVQMNWREEYNAENLPTEEWKKIWQEQNFDEKTILAEKEFLDSSEPIIDGKWTAEIEIPKPENSPKIIESDRFRFTADSFAVMFENLNNTESNCVYIPMIEMSDGTAFIDTGTEERKLLESENLLPENENIHRFAYMFGDTMCYDGIYNPESIEKITVFKFDYDIQNFKISVEPMVIYER